MSYVTNPIANRLGIQQGWYNPLISLRSGLTNISFITYLKCYLLMQEYLRYNQINLVFFEIKPLQKNKKLIHLFVYKNIFHLVKNELTFDSRKELAKNGFLQLSLYLYRKKIKLYKLKAKRKYSISYYDCCKKTGWANQSAALRSVLKQSSHLKNRRRNFDLVGERAKRFVMKSQSIRKMSKLRTLPRCLPNVHKNKIYYKKKHVLWKMTKNHFLNSKKLKRKYKRRGKKNRKFRKYQAKRKSSVWRVIAKKWQLRQHSEKKALRHAKHNVNKNRQRWQAPKPYVQKKNKKTFQKQNNNFAAFLQIRKWLDLKGFFSNTKRLQNLQNRRKKFRNMRHMLWRYTFLKPLIPKLVPALLSFNFAPKVFKKWLQKNLEWSKSANPLQFVFFIKSYIARRKKRAKALRLHNIQFNKNFGKPKKLKLLWKNRALYDLKIKKEFAFYKAAPLAFARYMSFINAYQKQQKFSKINSIKLEALKPSIRAKLARPRRFHFRNFDSKFQKLHVEFRFFIEKYVQKYLRFPVVAKIKNISDFVDLRANQKTTDYTRHVFLKPVAGKNFFVRLLHALLSTERIFNPQLFIDLIATEMQKTNNYRKLVNNMILMFSVLHSEHIMGYKILIDGKLGGSKQKSTKQIFKLQNKEKIPIQTFTKNVSYALGVARTPAGLFGIRMWLYY